MGKQRWTKQKQHNNIQKLQVTKSSELNPTVTIGPSLIITLKKQQNADKTSLVNVGENISFGLTCFHRPPSTHTQNFFEDIEAHMSVTKPKNIDIIIGEVNINNQDEALVNSYIAILNHIGFHSALNSPSRVTYNPSSCLGLIFVRRNLSAKELKYSTFVIDSTITDHHPIMNSNNKESFNPACV